MLLEENFLLNIEAVGCLKIRKARTAHYQLALLFYVLNRLQPNTVSALLHLGGFGRIIVSQAEMMKCEL